MSHRQIRVWERGAYDQTRWLALSRHSNGQVTLHLADLCLPGKLSRMTSSTLPVDYLKSAIVYGAFQITTNAGYLLLRRSGECVQFEFKSIEDASSVKGFLLASDLMECLHSADAEPGELAMLM